MSKFDDLQTLVRLLNEFELPVSPILEYAIKEKIEQLSSDSEEQTKLLVQAVPEDEGKTDVYAEEPVRNKKRPSTTIRVIRADGTAIGNEKAASTFCQAIKEVGVKNVYSLKMPMDGMHLVTIGGNPQYPTAQHDVGGGYFVNVHSSTMTKKRQQERIFSALNVNWSVEIVESN